MKKLATLILFSLFLGSLIQPGFASLRQSSFNIHTSGNSASPIAGTVAATNFTEAATSWNGSNGLRFSNITPGSGSIEIPAHWQASGANLTINNLQENRTWTYNNEFNSLDDLYGGWSFHENSSALNDSVMNDGKNDTWLVTAPVLSQSTGGWADDSEADGHNASYITLNGTLDDWNNDPMNPDWEYDYYNGLSAYFEQPITIPRGEVTTAAVDCDICLNKSDWLYPTFEIYFSIVTQNETHERILGLTDFRDQASALDTWQHLKFDVDVTQFNFTTNDTIYFRYGLGFFQSGELGGSTGYPEFEADGVTPVLQSPNQTVYFDNIDLNLQTCALPSDVNLTVNVGNAAVNVTDVDWSQGNATWANLFPVNPSNAPVSLEVQFLTNWTGCVLDWRITVNASTTTAVTTEPVDPYDGIGVTLRGMSYAVSPGQPVNWQFYLHANIPPLWQAQYQIWMNISPEWRITTTTNPDFKDLTKFILGGNLGDGFFAIRPENLTASGFWTIDASSLNYNLTILDCHGANFAPIKNWSTGAVGNLTVNLTQCTGLPDSLLTSTGNLAIYHPNGSVFFSSSAVPTTQGLINFPTFWVAAKNTSIGSYLVAYWWTNGTAVGYNVSTVVIGHATRINLVLPSNYVARQAIPALYGSSLALRVALNDTDANALVSGESLTLLIIGNSYPFTESSAGVYDITFDSSVLPAEGLYNCTIFASGTGLATDDVVIQVNFFVPQTMTWILAGVIIGLAAVIAGIVVRAKIVVPRRQREYNAMLEYTSNYYDAHNLVGYIILYKSDGIAIFDQWQDITDKHIDANLISGFLTAISAFREEIPLRTELKDFRDDQESNESNEGKFHTMTMDYEDFVIVMQDGAFCRVAAIFAMRPSLFFADRMRRFLQEFEETHEDDLIRFHGAINPFEDADGYFTKYVQFAMTRPVCVNESTKAKKMHRDIELAVDEQRMLDNIETILRETDYVRLRTVVNLHATASKDAEFAAVKGVVGLWFKNLLEPVDPQLSLATALRFFSEEDAEILAIMVRGTNDLNEIAAVTALTREGLDAKIQSFRGWKLVNLQDEVTEKGKIILKKRLAQRIKE